MYRLYWYQYVTVAIAMVSFLAGAITLTEATLIIIAAYIWRIARDFRRLLIITYQNGIDAASTEREMVDDFIDLD